MPSIVAPNINIAPTHHVAGVEALEADPTREIETLVHSSRVTGRSSREHVYTRGHWPARRAVCTRAITFAKIVRAAHSLLSTCRKRLMFCSASANATIIYSLGG